MVIPKWGGKEESCPQYIPHIAAWAEYYECGDAMDKTELVDYPTKAEYMTLKGKASLINDEREKISLYKQNK